MAAAAFPSLKPSTRSWTPGSPPVATFSSLSGVESRVLLGAAAVGSSLQLSFENRTEADAQQVTDHFAAANGMYEVFDLPAEAFAGMASFGHVKPSAFKWRYQDVPAVTYQMPNVVSVVVKLVAVGQ